MDVTPTPGVPGQLPPAVRVRPPGPNSRALTARLEAVESPAFRARRGAREGAAAAEMGPIVYAEGLGSNVFDADGNRYVDMTAGFGALLLGHRPPAIGAALEAQGARLWHALGDVYASDVKVALMERLAALFEGPGARVLLGQSGADAVTAAMKTAVLATGKPGVVAFAGGYHGMSYAPLAASGLRDDYRLPFAAQLNPHARFLPFAAEGDDLGPTLEALDAELAHGDVGALVYEPVLGRGGCLPPAAGLLAEMTNRARAKGAVVVADEIWTGLGRAGSWLFSAAEGASPDLVCLGKGLGGGLPLSACVGRGEVFAAWGRGPDEVVHTATFHGAPLACATSLALIDALEVGGLVGRAACVGAGWQAALAGALAGRQGARVHGRGLMVGVTLPRPGHALAASRELLRRGYVVLTGGARSDVLTLTPPLNIDEALLYGFVGELVAAVEGHGP